MRANAENAAGRHCTFQVVWMESRRRYEVHGDDGELHGFAGDEAAALRLARREAAQAERGGRVATICIEQKDGSLRTAPNA
jgi:hypothetical protein